MPAVQYLRAITMGGGGGEEATLIVIAYIQI